MTKKSNKNNRNGSNKTINKVPIAAIDFVKKTEELKSEADELALKKNEELTPSGSVSTVLNTQIQPLEEGATLEKCWKIATEARQLYQNVKEALDRERIQLASTTVHSEQLLKVAIDLQADAESKLNNIASQESSLAEGRRNLQVRESELLKKELDARNGFWTTYEDILKETRTHVHDLQQQMTKSVGRLTAAETEAANLQCSRIAELEASFQLSKNKYWEASAAELAVRSADLDSRDDSLRQREQQLRHNRAELDGRTEILDEDRALIGERIEQQVESRSESLRSELTAVRLSLAAARERRDQLENVFQKRLEADRQFGNRTPNELLAQRDELQAKLAVAEQKLASRLSETSVQELISLRDRSAQLETEHQILAAECARLHSQLENSRIAVSEMEMQRRHKEILETQKKFLEGKIDELKKDIEQYTEKASGKYSFPACCEMDSGPLYQDKPVVRVSSLTDLKAFVSQIQQLIAQQGLFYSEQDIRSFLGGLAMSKLHILQGISGTGKTSLPVAFAKSICAEYSVIGVQAGWREHADLIGHYNVFEKEFHETDFLKALYKAQTPAFSDRLCLVVLDEMNLSRPEQYCSELLMALEQGEHERQLTVHSNRPAGSPNYLLGNGKIILPSNVWFIGTANHDETTVEFADKTYDRAHVMELPSRYPRIEVGAQRPFLPVSFERLTQAFALAQINSDSVAHARRVFEYFNRHLSHLLNCRFRVGWGNRLERQLLSYIPVVMSSGGTLSEGADHILATKILRKIRDRYDLKREDMLDLQKQVSDTWSNLDSKCLPINSLAIIENEIARRGAD